MPISSLRIVKSVSVENIYSIYYFAYTKDFRFKGESHPFYELIYCDTGEIVITDNGEEFVLEAGVGFVHPPNHFHTVRSNGCLSNVFIVSFDASFKTAPPPPFFRKKTVFFKPEKDLMKTIIRESQQAFLDSVNGPAIIRFQRNQTAPLGAVQMISNSVEALLILIARQAVGAVDPKADARPKNAQEFIAHSIIAFLKENIFNPITFTDVVQTLNYSPSHIKRVFSAVTGCGVMQYLSRLRIEEAKVLLADPTNSVSHIADILQFDSPQHFSGQFKRHTFMSPSAYRNAVSVSKLLIAPKP